MPEGLEKPGELTLFEQVREMGIPLVAGGLMDQPHIWVMVYGVIRNQLLLWEAISGANNVKQPGQQ